MVCTLVELGALLALVQVRQHLDRHPLTSAGRPQRPHHHLAERTPSQQLLRIGEGEAVGVEGERLPDPPQVDGLKRHVLGHIVSDPRTPVSARGDDRGQRKAHPARSRAPHTTARRAAAAQRGARPQHRGQNADVFGGGGVPHLPERAVRDQRAGVQRLPGERRGWVECQCLLNRRPLVCNDPGGWEGCSSQSWKKMWRRHPARIEAGEDGDGHGDGGLAGPPVRRHCGVLHHVHRDGAKERRRRRVFHRGGRIGPLPAGQDKATVSHDQISGNCNF